MKAPVTTHVLPAESKLSCTNVKKSDKRTQTIGIVATMRINHGEHLPTHFGCSPLEYDLTTSPALSPHYSNGEENKGEGYGRRKEEKARYKDNINAIKLNHSYTGRLSLSKDILKAIFIPRRL